MPRSLLILFIILGLAILIGAFFAVWQTLPPLSQESAENKTVSVEPIAPQENKNDPARGDPKAPLAIFVYSDFECLHCAEAAAVEKQLLEKYPDKVRLVWKDMPNTHVHFKALGAHAAARCAQEQGKFWEYHDLLFERQLELSAEKYLGWAGELGLDNQKFQSCLLSSRGREIVQNNRLEGLAAGVDATPYYFIGSERRSGAVSLEEFEGLIP